MAGKLAAFRRLGLSGPMALVFLVMPPLGSLVLLGSLGALGPWLRDHGTLGWLIYTVVAVLLIGLSLLPTYACSILAGWAFGFAIGAPLAIAAVTLGGLLAYAIGIGIARDRVVGVINESPKWRAVHEALLSGRTKQTLLVVILVRIPPFSPYGITNFLFAATRVPIWEYALGTFIGIIPRTVVTTYISAVVQQALEFDEKPDWFITGSSIALVAVTVVITVMANRALKRVTS